MRFIRSLWPYPLRPTAADSISVLLKWVECNLLWSLARHQKTNSVGIASSTQQWLALLSILRCGSMNLGEPSHCLAEAMYTWLRYEVAFSRIWCVILRWNCEIVTNSIRQGKANVAFVGRKRRLFHFDQIYFFAASPGNFTWMMQNHFAAVFLLQT